jgi:hypothetical protein
LTPGLKVKHAYPESVFKVTSDKETFQILVELERQDALLRQFV